MRGGFGHRMMTGGEEKDFDLRNLDRRILGMVWGYARPYVGTLVLATISMLVVTAATLAAPYLTKMAIDNYILQGDLSGLTSISLIILGVFGLQWFSSYWQTYLSRLAGERIVGDVRIDLYSHVQKMPIDFFKRNQTGDIMSRITHDVNALSELVTNGFVHILNDFLTVFGIVAIMLLLNWELALITFISIPLIVIVMRVLGEKMRNAYREVRERLADLNADVEESISGIRVVQALNREAVNTGEFGRLSRQNLRANLRAVSVVALFSPTRSLSRVLGEGLVLWYWSLAVIGGAITLGVVVAFMQYVRRFFAPLADLSQVYNTLQSAGASLDRITEYLELETPITEAKEPRRPEGGFRGEISLQHVTFAYEETPVIEDLNLEISAGERFALVGQTGAGKTTIVNLLARLYDVDDGRITLDGIDLREIASRDLRRTVGVVPQDVFLFDTSIAENIRYGKPEATDEEIREIARQVHAHDFISRLPEQYDTQVGEGGLKLSGGQRQLVSFARAMLSDPTVLILDEATSSVDAHTEMLIKDALEILLEDRTSLIIAHRFSTLRRANRIGVLESGRLTAVGTHEELVAKSSIYRDLLQKQGMAV